METITSEMIAAAILRKSKSLRKKYIRKALSCPPPLLVSLHSLEAQGRKNTLRAVNSRQGRGSLN